MKTVKFYTLGCKVNQYDTQNIRERYAESGFKESDNGCPADVCVINTCTVTHKADADSLNAIRKAKRQNPKARIIVTGCLAELDEKKVKGAGASDIIKSKDKEVFLKGISYFKGHTRAFLKVQDGCNHFCSYCKVPLVRGRSRSRPLKDILQEAERLVKHGHKEIVLCGICLGAYGKDLKPKVKLTEVIGEFEEIKGLFFIRLSSIELNDITDGLIKKMAHSKKLCPHLHIPLQSGDDEILKKMNRNYSSGDFVKKVLKIKKNVPGIAITTDVLVGFPGEKEENFQNTLKVIKKVMPLKVHAFPYSAREGTLAAEKFKQSVDAAVVKKRMKQLKDLAEDCSRSFIKKFLNKRVDALIERRWKEDPSYWQGHTQNYIEVLVKSKLNLQNKIIQIERKHFLGYNNIKS